MPPVKHHSLSSDSFDGGVAELLEDNLSDEKTKRGKRSFLLLKDHDEGILKGVVNDDEFEKRKRKEEAKLQEKERVEKAKSAAIKPSPFSLLSNLTPAELEEHYTQCIRMCNQNKVNSKNAFKLQLIDYMKLILMTQNKKTENLSLMSCTLDASAKIYSCRVDKVYSDMMKIMSGKVWVGGDDTDATDDDNSDKDEGQEEVPKKKKKSDKVEKEDNIDFEKMLWSEARLDKGEADSELTNYINYGRNPLPVNAEFFLDCPISEKDGELSLNCHIFCSSEVTTSDNVLKYFTTRYSGNFDSLDPATIIPGYKEMYTNTNDETVVVNKNLVYDKDSHLIPDSLRLADETENIETLDNDGIPMVDYDECMSDDGGVEPTPLSSQNSSKIGQISNPMLTSFSVNSMSRLVTARRSDYSFFDNSRVNFIAGPVHWSIRNHKRKLPRSTEAQTKSTKKEGKIDFSFRNIKKLRKIFDEKAKLIGSSKTKKIWYRTSYCVPLTIYNQRDIVSLYRDKKLIYINNDFKYGLFESGSESKIKNMNESLTPEDFIVGDNGQNDDGDIFDDARDELDDPVHENNEESIPTESHEFPHNNDDNRTTIDLVPAPPKVNKISIKYAKVQKRVDIKLLKSSIWDYMKLDRQENNIDIGSIDAREHSDKSTTEVKVKLSDVFKALPGKLPEEEATQLSFPLVFMAILHMANEKTLKLIGNEHYTDVEICLG